MSSFILIGISIEMSMCNRITLWTICFMSSNNVTTSGKTICSMLMLEYTVGTPWPLECKSTLKYESYKIEQSPVKQK